MFVGLWRLCTWSARIYVYLMLHSKICLVCVRMCSYIDTFWLLHSEHTRNMYHSHPTSQAAAGTALHHLCGVCVRKLYMFCICQRTPLCTHSDRHKYLLQHVLHWCSPWIYLRAHSCLHLWVFVWILPLLPLWQCKKILKTSNEEVNPVTSLDVTRGEEWST